MGYENSAGLNVHNHYGPRETGAAVGTETGKSGLKVLRIDFTGRSINEGFVPPVVLPVGVRVERYRLRVDEAFALTGTSPTLRVGAAGNVATNGVVITQAELQAVGTKAPASAGAGTWATNSATGTTVAAAVDFNLGGTTPAVNATQGKATLFVEYLDVAKA